MEQIKDHSMERTILETAERLFLDKGFALTSTTEIAREVGCNQALVHYYFRTKELLFRQVFAEKVKTFANAFFSIDEQGGTFLERMKRKIEVHFDIVSRNPKIPFLILNEITTNPERMQAIRESVGEYPSRVIAQVAAELDEAIAKGEVRPVTIFDLAVSVLSLNIMPFLISPVLQNVMPLPKEEVQRMILRRRDENVALILKWLQPESPSPAQAPHE